MEIYTKSLYFRGDRIYIDSRTSYGRARISTKLTRSPKNELYALEHIEDYIYDYYKEIPLEKLSLARAIKLILAECEHLKASTLSRYKSLSNHILSHFGDRDMRSFTQWHFLEYARGCNAASLKLNVGFLNRIITTANERANLNLKHISIKKIKTNHEPKAIEPFNLDEIKALLQACENNDFRHYLIFAFFTGARCGEIAALEWGDIDFEHNKISIHKTASTFGITKPKTKSSVRTIDMLPIVKQALLEQKQLMPSGAKYVFGNGYEPPMMNRYRKMWGALLKRCNLKPRVLYNTRHSFASVMLQKGEEPLWVSAMLGHKNLNITFSTYVKFLPDHNKIRAGFIDFNTKGV